MSSGVKKILTGAAIIGALAIPGVGAFLGPIAVGILTNVGVAVALSGVSELFYTAEASKGMQSTVTASEAVIPVVYGQARVGLRIADYRTVDSSDPLTPSADPTYFFTGAEDGDVLAIVGALAIASEDGSGIEDVQNIRFYGEPTNIITDPDIDSVISVTNLLSKYQKFVRYIVKDGDDAQTIPTALSTHLGWSSTSKGIGVAYLALFLNYDDRDGDRKNVWTRGIPNVTALVKGQKVYDPRTTTWAWSENPALCILDYLTSKRYGAGRYYPERDGGSTALSEIDEQSFIDAANYCEDSVNWGSGSQDRFRMGGAVDTSRPFEQNLADMLSCCRGDLILQGGKYRLVIRQSTTAESLELTEDNIIGEWEWSREGAETVPNRIEASFLDERNENYISSPVIWPLSGDDTYLTADNDQENKLELSLPFTPDYYQALQTIMVMLREARQDVVVSVTCKEECADLQIGEVVKLTHSTPGWTQKEFWIVAMAIYPNATVRLTLREYDSSVYSLDSLSARDTLPGTNLPTTDEIDPPTGLTAVSGDSTVIVTQGGAIIPRFLFSWTPPSNIFLDHYVVQLKLSSDSTWYTVGKPDSQDTELYISNVVEGNDYDIRIQSINRLGIGSDWASITNQTVSTHTVLPLPQNAGDIVQVLNGGFEAGFAYWGAANGTGIMSLETTLVYSGTNALKITKSGASNEDIYQVTDARDADKGIGGLYLYLRVKEGDQVKISGEYRTDGTIDARVGIRQFDQDKVHVSWQTSTLTATASYTAIDETYTIASGVYYIALLLSTTTAATTGVVYFDTVVIQKLVDGTQVTDDFDLTAHNFYADQGTIGGWTLASDRLYSGSFELNADNEQILIGSATAPLTGNGIFIGYDGSSAYDLRAGDPAGAYVHWDGSAGTLTLHGAVIESPASTSDLTIQGWTHNLVFAADDYNTVSWGTGTIVFPYGGTFNISVASDTGNITQSTYIYLDTAVSTTALQTSIVHTDSVGANKVLIAVASPNADTAKDAEFAVFGGGYGVGFSKTVYADSIAANTITGNEIVSNTITATHISSLSFSGKTATFDTGSVGGWTMSSGTLTSGNVTISATAERILMGSASAPLTGAGIFLGKDGSDYEARFGDPAGDYIHFDGSTLDIHTETFTGSNPVFTGEVWIEAGDGYTRLKLLSDSNFGGIQFFSGTTPTFAGSINAGPSTSQLQVAGDTGGLKLDATGGSVVIGTFADDVQIQNTLKVDTLIVPSTATASGIDRILTNTKTWNPGTVASFDQATTTITVTGAQVGDTVAVSNEYKADDKAFEISGRVTSTNTVTLYLHNTYASGSVGASSRTVRVFVFGT